MNEQPVDQEAAVTTAMPCRHMVVSEVAVSGLVVRYTPVAVMHLYLVGPISAHGDGV